MPVPDFTTVDLGDPGGVAAPTGPSGGAPWEPPEGIPSPSEQVAASALGTKAMPAAVTGLAARIGPT